MSPDLIPAFLETVKKQSFLDQVDGFAEDEKLWYFHSIAFVQHLKRIFSGPSLKEARVRAFMRMLRVGEGVVGEKGYETLFGGSSFITDHNKNWDDHPKIDIPMPNSTKTSSAAGAYQIMGYTWDGYKKYREKYEINSFKPLSQDYFAVVLLKHKRPKAWPLLLEGKIKESITLDKKRGYSYEWASLPPGRYPPQRSESMERVLSLFDKYFNEEMEGKTDLHIEYGFLEDKFSN